MSESVSGSLTVEADLHAVMDVIGDLERYPEWQEEVEAVEVLETDADGWPVKASFSVDAKVLRTRYTLAYSYTDTTMDWWLVEGEHVRRIDGRYLLDDNGDGTTGVTYELEVEPAISLPKPLRRLAAQRIVDRALEGLKQRVEDLG